MPLGAAPSSFFFKGLRRLLADNGQSVENVSMNDGVDDIQTVAVFTQGFYPNVTNCAMVLTLHYVKTWYVHMWLDSADITFICSELLSSSRIVTVLFVWT